MLCMHAAKVQMRKGRSHRIGWMAWKGCHARRLWRFEKEHSPTARSDAGGGREAGPAKRWSSSPFQRGCPWRADPDACLSDLASQTTRRSNVVPSLGKGFSLPKGRCVDDPQAGGSACVWERQRMFPWFWRGSFGCWLTLIFFFTSPGCPKFAQFNGSIYLSPEGASFSQTCTSTRGLAQHCRARTAHHDRL